MTSHLTCKLCEKPVSEVGPLQASHIIPRSILKKSKNRDGKAIMSGIGLDKSSLSQVDWKEHLLCKSCEHIVKLHEDVLVDTLYQRRSSTVVSMDDRETVLLGSAEKLALAALTIFWRSSVSSLPEFGSSFIPPSASELARQWILNGKVDFGWHHTFTVKIEELVLSTGGRIEVLMPTFYRRREDHFEFVFICGGYILTFRLPSSSEQIFSRTRALKPGSRIVRIPKVPFSQIPELYKVIQVGLAATLTPSAAKVLADVEGRDRISNRRQGNSAGD